MNLKKVISLVAAVVVALAMTGCATHPHGHPLPPGHAEQSGHSSKLGQ